MKILVFAHELEIGGTQVNAIELSAALRDWHGCDVALFATPGPLEKLVAEQNLRFYPAPVPSIHPSPARIRALRAVVRKEQPDLLHVWDWWQCLEAYYGVHLPMRIPMLVTDMMMEPTRILPKRVPTTFGTPEVAEQARERGHANARYLLPPVDIGANAPGVCNGEPFRKRHGIAEDETLFVSVSRLTQFMKSESVLRTMDVVRELGRELPVRYIAVGDGAARKELERRGDQINRELGRPAITFPGALVDPRPAYAAADAVIGMGGSALRGMAFAKPVIVVGVNGFAATLAPESAEAIFYRGTYGHGDGSNSELAASVRQLATDSSARMALGDFSRKFVVERYSLQSVSAQLLELCRSTARRKPAFRSLLSDSCRTAAVYLRERRFLTPSRPTARELSKETA